MKFLVISDLHGNLEVLDKMNEVFKQADGVIFAGDFAKFGNEETGLPALEKKEVLSLSDLAEYFAISTSKIQQRGKVERGDKTMYDALIEACESLKNSSQEGKTIEDAFMEAQLAAKEGVEKSKNMISRKGRSKNFRDKTYGHADSGAVSTSLIFEALSEAFSSES